MRNPLSAMSVCIQFLGKILAIFFAAIATEAVFRIGYERKRVDIMREQKINAYLAMVDVVEESLGNTPYHMVDEVEQSFRSAVSRESQRIESYKRWCCTRKWLNTLIVVLAYLISFGFIVSWILLLVSDKKVNS